MRRREFVGSALLLMGGGLAACSPGIVATRPRVTAAAFDQSRRYAQTTFGRIAYAEKGTGDAALFLHGFPLSSYQWRDAVELLAPHRRCVAPDFMGLGHTEVPDSRSVAPDEQVAMLVALLDQLSISAADVIASDSGGAVAQLLVARHPQRVRTLLLTNCDTEIDSPPAALLPVIEMARAGTFVDQWLAAWLADRKLARSAQGIGGMCYADPAHPTDDAIASYFAPLVGSPQRKARVHDYAIALERNPLEGVESTLRRCAVPMRVVWGMADTIFSPASPDYLDRTFGNSRGIRRLTGSKLFWPEERPDVVAEEALSLWGVRAA